MKIWEKGQCVDPDMMGFTIGDDKKYDLQLAPHDIMASAAHAHMLAKVGLIGQEESLCVIQALEAMHTECLEGYFALRESVEDVHSEIEARLIEEQGDAGKKIHTARSRNDQVLVALKLFYRHELLAIIDELQELIVILLRRSNEHAHDLLPGYTHMQVAMPSSFGLWFGAYAEGLIDDLEQMKGVFQFVNRNPLGSAAGYGSSFPINRSYTGELLAFDGMHVNVVYAQMSRGKTERLLAGFMASLGATLGKWAQDTCLYQSQNFGFISLPDELTTGSSIMPHKKNPDIIELIRGECALLQALPSQVTLLLQNMPSGYHREVQLLKGVVMPAMARLRAVLRMSARAVAAMQVVKNLMNDQRYALAFSVENVNQKVLNGATFRDAYREVASDIAAGTFEPQTSLNHTHEGSLGNLMNEVLGYRLSSVVDGFETQKYEEWKRGFWLRLHSAS
ncbi:MAG TPA: argininosuccinate lyase [Luteibaculaceae bacterium]|nr:argininosuccinate lyase [Luteibaculaceae bacterium]